MLKDLFKKKTINEIKIPSKIDANKGLEFLKKIESCDDLNKLNLLKQTNIILNQIEHIEFDLMVTDLNLNHENKLEYSTSENIDSVLVKMSNEEVLLNNVVGDFSSLEIVNEDDLIELTKSEEKELQSDDLEDIEVKSFDDLILAFKAIDEKKISFKNENEAKKILLNKVINNDNIVKILELDNLDENIYNDLIVENIEMVENFETTHLKNIILDKRLSSENKEALTDNVLIRKMKEELNLKYILRSKEELNSLDLLSDSLLDLTLNDDIAFLTDEMTLDFSYFKEEFYKDFKISSVKITYLLKNEINAPYNLLCEENEVSLYNEQDLLLFLNSEDINQENTEKILNTYHKNMIEEGLPVIGKISLENYNLLVEKVSDIEQVLEDLQEGRLKVKDLSLRDSISKLVHLLNEKSIVSLLKNKELVSEEFNQVILENEMIIILDPIFLTRLNDYEAIDSKTVEALENRYYLVNGNESIPLEESKKYQLELVSRYKDIIETKNFPKEEDSSNAIVEINYLYQYSKKEDKNISKGFTLNNVMAEDLVFDSDRYEIIDDKSINSLVMSILKSNPSKEFIEYVYNLDQIAMEFKIGDILKARNCSYKIIDVYQNEKDLIPFIVLNQGITGNRLIRIAGIVASVFPEINSEIYKRILDHPNAPIDVIKNIFEGVGKLASDISEETDSDKLYDYFMKILYYPETKSFHFDIDQSQQSDLLYGFLKNENTPESVLNYYTDLYGESDDDVIDKVVAHRNSSEKLISRIFLANYNSSEPAKKYMEKNTSLEEIVSLSLTLIERIDISIDSQLPASLIYLLNNQKDLIASFNNSNIDEEKKEILLQLQEISSEKESILYNKKLKEYHSVLKNSNNSENINVLINNLENDVSFYDGLFNFKLEDKQNLLILATNNPFIKISEKSRLIEEYDLK